MRFPRTLRLDTSDLQALPRAAEPGEWAVPGGFEFVGRDPAGLSGKERLALRSAWLGTGSFGFSTLVEVAEISEAEFFAVVERLACHFVSRHGAPDLGAALPAAREEVDYAAGLCDRKLHTLLAIERDLTDSGLVERFRVIRPRRSADHARIWDIVPDSDE